MKKEELFVGKKVWLKPSALYRDLYDKDYVETEIAHIGLKLITLKDDIRPRVKYRLSNLKESTSSPHKGCILLSMDGVEDFDRKEQLIIRVRKHFNSRTIYNESEENILKVIELLKL